MPARQVAEATGTFAMVMDRSGHRLAGPAVSEGAKYFNAEGYPAMVGDEGFKKMAQLMVDWHADGTMMPEVWIGSGGSYVAGNEPFINGQVALYMSGSWQVGQFADKIADAFDWEAVPNPCGPGGCTGMPGGAALVAINTTEHPEEVARVMEYLTQEDVMAEFYGRTLFIPGHLGLADKGIDFDTDLPQAKQSLEMFASQVGKLAAACLRSAGLQVQHRPVQRQSRPSGPGVGGRNDLGRGDYQDARRHRRRYCRRPAVESCAQPLVVGGPGQARPQAPCFERSGESHLMSATTEPTGAAQGQHAPQPSSSYRRA